MPDITGELHGVRRIDQIKNEPANSAINWYSSHIAMAVTQAATSTPSDISFKASWANNIYGASVTVMPASIESPIALYLGRIAQI